MPTDTVSAREIRVFVSSTFRDMQADRDVLVKKVFPRLRRKCEERAVTWTEVDLRWGITSEDAAEGKVLPLCLAEIDRCRPYFIALLGDRYGWVPGPEALSGPLLQQHPWLGRGHAGRSITELEILHGVLNDPAMAGHACFYFRAPGRGAGGANNESVHDTEKLAALKERIRSLALDGQPTCVLRENYRDPEALADLVLADLDALIDRLYPANETPDPDLRETMGHQAYARGKLFCHVSIPGMSERIEQAFAGAQALLVTGESGGGKSSLLAAWERGLRERGDGRTFVFSHYFGATPDSAQALSAVRRLLLALKKHFAFTQEIPDQADDLRKTLPDWLARTGGQGQVVLVLDALDRLAGAPEDLRLAWLPRHLPPQVRVLCSALPGPALEAWRSRAWPELELRRPEPSEREAMIATFLGHFRKTLPAPLLHRLATSPQAGNPLYLRTVLDELRQFGSHEELQRHLEHLLAAPDLPDLFGRVMVRWETDFEDDTDLVGDTLSLIWASRAGLAEGELLALLGEAGQPLPRQRWTPLLLAMDSHLCHQDGLLTFGHQYLRDAVEQTYLPDPKVQRRFHLRIADHFAGEPGMGPRKASEWPWQLHAAEDWDRLQACLLDPTLIEAFPPTNNRDLRRYWQPLRERGVDMEDCYRKAWAGWAQEISDDERKLKVLSELKRLLDNCGLPRFGLENRSTYSQLEITNSRRLWEESRRTRGEAHRDTWVLAMLLRNAYTGADQWAESVAIARETYRAGAQLMGPHHPETLTKLLELYEALLHTENSGEADSLLTNAMEGALDFVRQGYEAVVRAAEFFWALRWHLFRRNQLGDVDVLSNGVLQAAQYVLGSDHPVTRQWEFLSIGYNDSSRSLAHHEAELRRCEKLYGDDHPDTIMALSLIDGRIWLSDPRKSLSLRRRILAAEAHVWGDEHELSLDASKALAEQLRRCGELAEADVLIRRELEVRERIEGPDHPETIDNLARLAAVLEDRGELEAAEPLRSRVLLAVEAKGISAGLHTPAAKSYLDLMTRMGRTRPEARAWLAATLIQEGVPRWQAMKRIEELRTSEEEANQLLEGDEVLADDEAVTDED